MVAIKQGDTRIFKTVQSDLMNLNGTEVQVVRVISEPDGFHDEEVLPMFELNVEHEGKPLECFEDELLEVA